MNTLTLTPDAQLIYEVHGTGYPLVLVHGHPFNRSMWSPQVAALQEFCQVVTFDLRGYGQSVSTGSYVSLDEFAGDIEALRAALHLEAFALAGLSMGGQIALEYYRQHPRRVSALLLLDTFATLDPAERRQHRIDTAARIEQQGMDAYAAELLPGMLSLATRLQQPTVAAAVLTMMQTAPPRGAAAALRGRANRRDYTDLLPTIQVPTLVMVGSEDEFTPIADAKFMHERIPNAQLVVLDGVGHLPTLEAPQECNAAIEQFLRHSLA